MVPQFDVKGLKKEISRQVLRQLKKVGKAEQRLRKAEARIKELDSCTGIPSTHCRASFPPSPSFPLNKSIGFATRDDFNREPAGMSLMITATTR